MVRLLYFAWVREAIGVEAEEVPLSGTTTLAALAEQLKGRSAGHARALADLGRLRAAVNQDFAGWDAAVNDGDEVALFPPVTGG
ncbi:molybdopterin converting factor subunit 1 [Thermaurantiacus sp.]